MALRISLFALVMLGSIANNLAAKPMHATFQQVVERSSTIAVARSLGDQPDRMRGTIRIEIVEVLKGDLKPGKREVFFDSLPHVGVKGEEMIAFLDEDRVWRFVASMPKGQTKLAHEVLEIRGFYDSNAYFVSPGLITLDQIKRYLKDGSLIYRFRGEVHFPEPGKNTWKPSTIVVSGAYDAIKKETDVKGLPNTKGFADQPEVLIHSSDLGEASVDLRYALTGTRPLLLIGQPHRIDNKTGEILIRFAVSVPEVLTQTAFETYLADTSIDSCYYRFKLSSVPTNSSKSTNTILLTLGKQDEHGSATRIETFDQAPLIVFLYTRNSGTFRNRPGGTDPEDLLPESLIKEHEKEDDVCRLSVKSDSGAYFMFAFDVGKRKPRDETFWWRHRNDLAYWLYCRETSGTIIRHDTQGAKTVATFTTAFDSVEFNRISRK